MIGDISDRNNLLSLNAAMRRPWRATRAAVLPWSPTRFPSSRAHLRGARDIGAMISGRASTQAQNPRVLRQFNRPRNYGDERAHRCRQKVPHGQDHAQLNSILAHRRRRSAESPRDRHATTEQKIAIYDVLNT